MRAICPKCGGDAAAEPGQVLQAPQNGCDHDPPVLVDEATEAS